MEEEEKIEEGLPITEEDRFWLNKVRELKADSIKSVEEAAKQMISLVTVMQGVYAAVLAFSEIKNVAKANFFYALFYVSPVFLWLISLFFLLKVFKTEEYEYFGNSPDSARNTIDKIAKAKNEYLTKAYNFLSISFGIAGAGIFFWFLSN